RLRGGRSGLRRRRGTGWCRPPPEEREIGGDGDGDHQHRDGDPDAGLSLRQRRHLRVVRGGGKVEVRCVVHVRLRLVYSCSTWWTNDTAIDPSPTADATRLMLPPRASPTANTPGRLVSSRCGERASGQRPAARSSGDRSVPVLMNFLSS